MDLGFIVVAGIGVIECVYGLTKKHKAHMVSGCLVTVAGLYLAFGM